MLVKRLHCINCLNAWPTNWVTFWNQKLCCSTVFLQKNDETKKFQDCSLKHSIKKGKINCYGKFIFHFYFISTDFWKEIVDEFAISNDIKESLSKMSLFTKPFQFWINQHQFKLQSPTDCDYYLDNVEKLMKKNWIWKDIFYNDLICPAHDTAQKMKKSLMENFMAVSMISVSYRWTFE